MSSILFVIDPQNDFMDSPKFTGSLAVSGAYADMQNLSNFLLTNEIDNVMITMDTHSTEHIAHKNFWVDEQGNKPSDFTIISVKDLEEGKWKTSNPAMQEWGVSYVKALADKGKYPLCIWPFHCVKGTKGYDVEETFANAVAEWEKFNNKTATYINKGHNDLTEHYSGLSAEVPVPNDPTTMLNVKAIEFLNSHDKIIIAGEALSHCVAYTTLDLLNNLAPADRSKVVLLKDAMSPVGSFEQSGQDFLKEAERLGAKIATTEKPRNSLGV